jgi:pimeloyl-ACP methyl ester carboxylesterase
VPLRSVPRMQTRVIHGHERAYVKAGRGPAVLLLHGLGCDSRTWLPVLDQLARRFTVVVPDLLGHGRSAKPRADYSIGGYANGMRDLLTVLGVERATVVGHSFGGGIAMQFAYQYPQRCERLVLVAPGGLGREVSPLLRALTVPGASLGLAAAASPPSRLAARVVLRRLAASGLPYTADLRGLVEVLEAMKEGASRGAFLHVLRSAVDWRGQVVTMADRAYLAAGMPTCIVWGDQDTVIPGRHAEAARLVLPAARVEVIRAAGHFPHEDQPAAFVTLLTDFVRSTTPSSFDERRWRALLADGGPEVRRVTEPA